MTRFRPTRVQRTQGRFERTLIAMILLVPTPMDAQEPKMAVDAWIDAYYADFAAATREPLGPAMDRWAGRYAPHAYFEDPSAQMSALGRDSIRRAFVGFFSGGEWGPVRKTVMRRAASGEWIAVEGWLEGSRSGTPFRIRYSSWFKHHNGQIVHQIDYLDNEAIRRQLRGEQRIPEVTSRDVRDRMEPGDSSARRIVDEFFRRYEAMPVVATREGIARHVDLLSDDFQLEDPMARIHVNGREQMRSELVRALETGEYGEFHWEIDRRVTDGEWVAVEGTFRGLLRGRAFGARFTTWLRVSGERIVHQIDYVDYTTLRKQTASATTGG